VTSAPPPSPMRSPRPAYCCTISGQSPSMRTYSRLNRCQGASSCTVMERYEQRAYPNICWRPVGVALALHRIPQLNTQLNSLTPTAVRRVVPSLADKPTLVAVSTLPPSPATALPVCQPVLRLCDHQRHSPQVALVVGRTAVWATGGRDCHPLHWAVLGTSSCLQQCRSLR